jgi:transposase
MTAMAQTGVVVTGGVEVHLDVHVAAAPDSPSAANSASTACRPPRPATGVCLPGWQAFGTVARVGIEATGSYGAGLAVYLTAEGIDVVEVDRPNR